MSLTPDDTDPLQVAPGTSPEVERLAKAVSAEAVRGLLSARPVNLLTKGDMAAYLAVERVGMATEVVAVTGDPIPDRLWSLAVRCTTLGLASSLEAAAYPEQQLGTGGRADQLRTRFLAVRADLLRLLDTSPTGTAVGTWAGFVSLA